MTDRRITNDDKDGNYLVEFFGPKRRVVHFQTRTIEDAKEEAWQTFHSRNSSTNRITTKVLVSQMRVHPGPPRKTWTRENTENIYRELWDRWDSIFANFED